MTTNYTAPTNDEERQTDFAETAESYFSDKDAKAVGTQAATRTYSDYLSTLARQEETTKLAYSDIFQRAKTTNYQQQAAATPGFTGVSGGQVDQVGQAQSAAAVAQLGDIGMARTQALGEIETQRLAAKEVALGVGRQAEADVMARQDRNIALRTEANEILYNDNVEPQQAAQQYNSQFADILGGEFVPMSQEDVNLLRNEAGLDGQDGWEPWAIGGAVGASLATAITSLKVGSAVSGAISAKGGVAAALKALSSAGAVGKAMGVVGAAVSFKFIAIAALIGAAVYGGYKAIQNISDEE